MPKSESKDSEKLGKAGSADDPEEAGSTAPPPLSKSQKRLSISVALAAKMRKKVTETRLALDEEDPQRIQKQEYEKIRESVYSLLERPNQSNAAFAVCGVIFLMIILSTIFCCAETLPQLETDYWHYFFFVADICFVIFFTVEYALRCWSSPMDLGSFILHPLNFIDLIALLPFYIELLVWLFFTSAHSNKFFRAFQTIRVLRLIRVGRFSDEMHFIGEALARSVNSFALMAYLLIVGIALFSCLLFTLERGDWDSQKGCYVRPGEKFFSGCSPYESVPMAAWWAITTMTTVGFGDAYPLSVAGRVACAFTMVCGLLCVAIPTTVLGVEFALTYKKQLAEKKATSIRKTLTARTKDELVLFQSMTKLRNITEELRAHLPYLKHLALADFEMNRPDEEHPLIDPTFSLYQNIVMLNLSNVKLFAQSTTSNLIF